MDLRINSYFVFDAGLMRCSCCAMERPACPRLKEKDCLMRVKASISGQATNQTPILQLFSNNPPIANRMGHTSSDFIIFSWWFRNAIAVVDNDLGNHLPRDLPEI